MSRVPCLLIAFSRLEGISRLLSSLNPSEIEVVYLAIDGPNSEVMRETQAQIINAAESYCAINSLRLVVWQRDENFGVAKSIISAIDWFFTYEEFGIILEDDLLVGEDFFSFVVGNQHLLENDDVLLISGNQFDHQGMLTQSKNWTTYPLIWGWATSKIKWEEMRYGIIHSKPRLLHRPFSKVENFWRVGTLRVRSRQIDTWDIPLVYFMLQNRKLCLTPEKNLISNLGNDQFASHTEVDSFSLNLPIERLHRSTTIPEPNVQHIREYNLFLEKRVFRIRKRHSFLYIYFVFSSLFSGKRHLEKLARHLQKIELP
jgi:hypothetical protein